MQCAHVTMQDLVLLRFEFARQYLVRPAELFLTQLNLHQISFQLLHPTAHSAPILLYVLQVRLGTEFTAQTQTHPLHFMKLLLKTTVINLHISSDLGYYRTFQSVFHDFPSPWIKMTVQC